MIVVAEGDRFVVTDPDDFTRFHVDVTGMSAESFAALVARSEGVAVHDEPDHVWVATSFIAEALETGLHESRREGLDAMLAYAKSKGWIDSTGSLIAAHVEMPPAQAPG